MFPTMTIIKTNSKQPETNASWLQKIDQIPQPHCRNEGLIEWIK